MNEEAAAELRAELRRGLARKDMGVEQLRVRTRLSRTTVSQALNRTDVVASAQTTARLAKALGLDEQRMLALREAALRDEPRTSDGVGRPISGYDPLDLEVHAAGLVRDAARALPGYVGRPHDEVARDLVREATIGRSGMAVLVGWSSTGKTRAWWEAVKPLSAQGWRLWHPYEPTHAQALLAGIDRVRPRTVVWLNDAQRYLDAGEEVAAALHRLLSDAARAPVLVLASLWPDDSRRYAERPPRGQADRFARTRELLAGRTIDVPMEFLGTELREGAALAAAGDRLWAEVLQLTHHGRVAQQLAGGPDLIRRYGELSAPAKALVRVAMDASRFGADPRLELTFLAQAAQDYLHDDDLHALEDEAWLDRALAELAHPVHGDLVPLRHVPARLRRSRSEYRLADYLEEHGRRERALICPPSSFWRAAAALLSDPGDLANLGSAAEVRHRLSWAATLYERSAHGGNMFALGRLAVIRDLGGDHGDAAAMAERAAENGHVSALTVLIGRRTTTGELREAVRLAQAAAKAGDPTWFVDATEAYEQAGDPEQAELTARLGADAGDEGSAFQDLAELRERSGDEESAARMRRAAADAGNPSALCHIARMHESVGEIEAADVMFRRALEAGSDEALYGYPVILAARGDFEEAEHLAERAAQAGNPTVLRHLARMRAEAGDEQAARRLDESAEQRYPSFDDRFLLLCWSRPDSGRVRVAEDGDIDVLGQIISEDFPRPGAQARVAIPGLAAEIGSPGAFLLLGVLAELAGDDGTAEDLYRRAIESGNRLAAGRLAVMRERAGRHGEAEVTAVFSHPGRAGTRAPVPDPRSGRGSRGSGAAGLVRLRERSGLRPPPRTRHAAREGRGARGGGAPGGPGGRKVSRPRPDRTGHDVGGGRPPRRGRTPDRAGSRRGLHAGAGQSRRTAPGRGTVAVRARTGRLALARPRLNGLEPG
ncbi:sel1 repeat family protein [Actinospica durhamensis]|uniref:Sel1 repeat family protein n=1 Tax=Actinospica durhamensis TaxID=1508375 RepID=A0A941IP57_9ACTN|nr:sel1 repeat family protein [Actinospica durhamensis]MBR7832767.1 sel1 repeat family protein [Actinospica durhamensis]